ncbi:hypothetical protein C8J56DRAFT_1026467 [Mycena floridula]|nr:hypothetical protein C8J56DRAFT_1026467 [Mycena floridula]
MPSFSLVRRFGKQRKVTVDSPVSSGLVEQHIRRQSAMADVFPSNSANDSQDLTPGMATLLQHVEGVSIRNINGPVMSNNQFAMLRVGDIYLEEEVERHLDQNSVWRTRYKGQITASSTCNMSIWSYHGERAEEELEKAYQVYASLPRHPNILQLYGICRSSHLTALVFHGAPYLIFRPNYYKMLPSSQWIPHYLKLHQQNESAHIMLEAHNLRGRNLRISEVDETGKLVIADFIPGPPGHSAFDPRIWTAYGTNMFIKEDLLDYYKFLFDMIAWSPYLPTSTQLSPFDKAVPFRLSHPEINLPVYSIPDRNKLVNGMYMTVGQTGIVLTLLPNMTIRCCIPTPQIPTFWIIEHMKLFEQDDMPLFATWACQANHFIHDVPINIMDLQTGKLSIPDSKKDTESSGLNNLLETEHLYLFCPLKGAGNINWSHDDQGQHVIEDSSIQAALGITVHCTWDNNVYPILPQVYQILQTIHEGCGFDPYGTQIAEYLGLPLAVIDNGHSELQECMEDPEESELGDSDYVSASEDV